MNELEPHYFYDMSECKASLQGLKGVVDYDFTFLTLVSV